MRHLFLTVLLAALAGSIAPLAARAQSADALLNKLVEKGVLTADEAKELRAEADKGFTKAHAAKTGMPPWVESFRVNGDFRGRYEGITAEHPDLVERHRLRYRARLGFTAVMRDHFEAGLRLASGDIDSYPANGLDPISSNQSFQNNASKKGIFIDLAYGRWTPLQTDGWLLALTAGKMENPMVCPDSVFDPDYTPEGFGLQLGRDLGARHTLRFHGGAFVLDEIGASTRDPYLLGAQTRLESRWTDRFSSSLGAAYLTIGHAEALANNAVPNINRGNTRTAAGTLANEFRPVLLDAAVTWRLDHFPFYPGACPVRLGGDYLDNPGADSTTDSEAWSAGITLGKAGKKGTWELAYAYKWLGADAWWEELVDSDFGAYYAAAPLNGGGGPGYYAGTNVRGHSLRLAYSPSDVLTVAARVMFTRLINEAAALTGPLPANLDSAAVRFQLDASLRF
jgi:hypothetical protein